MLTRHVDAPLRLSLITFGAPPVTSNDLTSEMVLLQQAREDPGIMLAIANEFDVVVRADRSYLLSLTELHRVARHAADSAATVVSSTTALPRPMWPLPPPEYYHLGQIVVLKVSVPEISDNTSFSDIALKAIQVYPTLLSNLVFCDTEVHSRIHYTKRTRMLFEGRCNNGTGRTAQQRDRPLTFEGRDAD
jgi:hypothetical protein